MSTSAVYRQVEDSPWHQREEILCIEEQAGTWTWEVVSGDFHLENTEPGKSRGKRRR